MIKQPKRLGLSVVYGLSQGRQRLQGLRSTAIAIGYLTIMVAPAKATLPETRELADLSLEQLSNIEVTSVSRHSERLLDATASIFVISAEDIRRSGVTSLPEALRLAPNLEVGRLNSAQYAISARGFANALANKLLVLIDGRTIYTPLFSGVFWDAQDVMLEDIERIEVISGPGGTLWGSNAVNGVINIITRSAKDTQGGLLAVGDGNKERGGAVRYGGALNGDGYYRVYAKYFDRSNTVHANGTDVSDASDKRQVGFRADWGGKSRGFTLQGDAYRGETEQVAPGVIQVAGMNLLARWNQQFSNRSEVRLQTYYDRTERTSPGAYQDQMDTLDLEFQQSIPLPAQKFLWGAGYRYTRDQVDNSPGIAFLPADKNLHWASVFAQDEISLRSNLAFTLGAKFESNVYTGVEFLPNARLAWQPTVNQLVWSAISRAVRAPARIDRDFFVPGKPPFIIKGGPNFESEVADVIELGYRAQPTNRISYSVTAFHNEYDKLRSGQPAPGGGFEVTNQIQGTGNGVEAWGSYQATRLWRLSFGVMELRQNLELKNGSHDPSGPKALGDDPKHQWQLRSTFNFTDRHELDVMLRHVSALPAPAVPAYTAVDARFGWRLTPDMDLSLTLQNLFSPKHLEFGDPIKGSYVERSFFLKWAWHM